MAYQYNLTRGRDDDILECVMSFQLVSLPSPPSISLLHTMKRCTYAVPLFCRLVDSRLQQIALLSPRRHFTRASTSGIFRVKDYRLTRTAAMDRPCFC
jgi:hypothetical protein